MFIEILKKYEKKSIFIYILMILLSILLMFQPLKLIKLIIYLFGGITIIDGILHIVSYFQTKDELRLMNFELVEGLLEIISGTVTIMASEYLIAIFPIIIGIWMIIKSIIKFQLGFNFKTVENSKWLNVVIMSILTFILGLIVLFNPFASAIVATATLGIILLIYSILNLCEAIYINLKFKE